MQPKEKPLSSLFQKVIEKSEEDLGSIFQIHALYFKSPGLHSCLPNLMLIVRGLFNCTLLFTHGEHSVTLDSLPRDESNKVARSEQGIRKDTMGKLLPYTVPPVCALCAKIQFASFGQGAGG